ncbi:MAG: sensor histidine kinase [Myxococcaceae bacterium]|nr:sensor histidine kinase [Myxococcaceae bacterium]
MDPALLPACQLCWSRLRTLTSVQGACDRVLGRSAEALRGMPLHEALGISEKKALLLDVRARQEGAAVEFVSAVRGDEPTVLRLSFRVDGDEVTCAVMDANAFVEGAPPLQISRLSSSLSHEIRNPLSSVKMAVQTLARNTSLSERDQRRLAIANREIRTMERMLGLLSEYGRDAPPHREEVALRAVVQDALALVEPELAERRIAVVFDEPPGLSRVRVDTHRVRLVLAQFLLNVAMGLPEAAELRVTLSPVPDGGVAMQVADPAAAVLEEERATLFEPFGSRLARGAGLSLAALRRVLQMQGADVAAESLADKGSLFTLTFAS